MYVLFVLEATDNIMVESNDFITQLTLHNDFAMKTIYGENAYYSILVT